MSDTADSTRERVPAFQPLGVWFEGDILYSTAPRFRADSVAYRWAYEDLSVRDTECCAKCGRITDLVIHHVKAQKYGGEHRLSNFEFLCWPDNQSIGAQERHGAHGLLRVRESDDTDELGEPRTERLHKVIDYQSGPIELQINDNSEPEFRKWLLAYVKSHGSIWFQNAIYAGAESVGCSPESTERHTKKATNEINGILKTWREKEFPKRKYIVALVPDVENFKKQLALDAITPDELRVFQTAHGLNIEGAN